MKIGLPVKRRTSFCRLPRVATVALLSGVGCLSGCLSIGSSSAGAGAAVPTGAPAPRAEHTTAPTAKAARSVYIMETAHLHLTSEGESSLGERGYASGTFSAPLSARLSLSPGHVSAVFTLYPKGGSITGSAYARFVVKGSTGYYGGTMRIVRGTGAYRRAAGSKIGVSGTINRYSFALSVKANGWMRL